MFEAAGRSPASNVALLEQMLVARSETADIVGCNSYSTYKAWGARCVLLGVGVDVEVCIGVSGCVCVCQCACLCTCACVRCALIISFPLTA